MVSAFAAGPETEPVSFAGSDAAAKARIRTLVTWSIVGLFGGIQAIAGRFYVNPDGVSYINLSDAYARGDWSAAVNGYWSPLYPWLIGQVRRLHDWSPYWESSVVHALNFAVYLISFACFRFTLRELGEFQREKNRAYPDRYVLDFSTGWEFAFAFGLFLWSGLILIGNAMVTPDMCVAAEAYLIAGMMIRVRRGRDGRAGPVILGVILAAGYFTKGVMFPVGVMVIAFTGWGKDKGRWTGSRRIVCALTFLIAASPQLIAVSRLAGYPTYGEVGQLAYATFVNRYPALWTGAEPNSGVPVHPVRRIVDDPQAYEFTSAKPSSSYPVWDEPAYWLKGMQPHFDLERQARAVEGGLSHYQKLFAPLFLAAVVLMFMGIRGQGSRLFDVCAVAVGVLVLYALVNVESRLVAPWGVILFLALSSSLAFREDVSSRAGVRAVLAAFAIWSLGVSANNARHSAQELVSELRGGGITHEYWKAASALQKLGVRRGQKVASIGRSSESYWARLAGVQIAMEIPPEAAGDYWAARPAEQNRVQKIFADHGADMIVASVVPGNGAPPPWIYLGSARYYALPLKHESP